jgi:NADPH:quinone reductase-like Zn-dependent oxidoreductase
MKAVQIHEFGGADKLRYEDAPIPQIKAGEVLIKVYAASVNPVDWKIREGYMKDFVKYTFPLTLGWDVSGVVEKVGDDVKDFKPGDEVYARPDTSRNGTYAEYVAVTANTIAIKPKSIDHIHASAIPLAGLTAWQALFDHGHLQAGQKVLIHGAAGGVGTLAIQLAKWKGAYVIGTASAKNATYLKELGADEVIDYTKDDFTKKVKDIDVVFDTIGGDTQKKSVQIIKPGGALVTIVTAVAQEEAKAKGIRLERFMAQSYPDNLKQMAALVDQGKLKSEVSKIFPLKDAAEAQKLSEEGHTRGKIVLKVV